jgi:acetolactate synthase-1/2/3 large subunit
MIRRLPYFPQEAASVLGSFEMLLVIDARRPVANFGYEGGPSHLIAHPDANVWELDSADVDIGHALRALTDAVGATAIKPFLNCGGVFCSPSRPQLPRGRLTAAGLCQTIASLQPRDAIIVDESLTSGSSYFEASAGCPPFTHLTLTGGAIGCGPPLSIGAAVACPERVVINIQADGSGMYAVQALWTQAREGLHVVTVVCSNRTYAILKLEMAKQRITPSNGAAARALTDIGSPPIDWVKLAQGLGAAAVRVDTCERLAQELATALDRTGPTVIEACI